VQKYATVLKLVIKYGQRSYILHKIQIVSASYLATKPVDTEGISPGLKQTGLESHYSPVSTVEV
jgi:hypothetical protein